MRYLLACLLCAGSLHVIAASDAQEKAAESKAVLTLDPGGHVGSIRQMYFTPDGERLVTCGDDKTLQIWDMESRERVKVLRPPVDALSGGIIRAAALSPDGKTLAVGGSGYIAIPGGKTAVNRAYLLNLDDGRILPLPELTTLVDKLAFSLDGSCLAVCTRGDTVRLWKGLKDVWRNAGKEQELKPWKAQTIWDRPNQCDALAFAPDGKRLAVTLSGGAVTLVWDVEAADGFDKTLRLLAGAKPAAGDKAVSAGHALAWSRDGKRLVTCNSPPASAVRVWSEKGELQHEFPLKDFQTAYKRANSNFYHASAFFRPGHDDEVVLLGSVDLLMRTVMLLDVNKKTVRRAFLDAPELDRISFELPGALSPDGNLVALPAMRNGNGIFLIDLTGKKEKHQIGGRSHPRQVGWSTQGATLAWAMTDPKKKLDRALDLNRGLDLQNLLLQYTIDPARFVKNVRARDGWSIERPPTKSGRGGIEILHDGAVKTQGGRFTQNPGSQWTFPAKGDVSWLAWTGKEELFLADPLGPKKQTAVLCVPTPTSYYALASSADGKYLLTSSTREMFHIYHPASKKPAALLMAFVNGADWIVWTQEGYYAATPGGEKMMGWTVNNGSHQVASFYSAERFRKQLYRPDVIALVLEKGNVRDALAAADAVRKRETRDVKVDDLLPPAVTLTVLDQSKMSKITVRARAQASVKEQPIKALRLFINGRPAPGADTQADFPEGKEAVDVTWTFALEEGTHQLAVLASSDDSANVSRAIPIKNVIQAKRPVLHVMTVGINQHQDPALDLRFAAPDAVAIGAGFAKHANGPWFRAVECRKPLLDQEATKKNILKELHDLRKKVRQQDLVVVFFACHGVTEGKDYYLLTHEANTNDLAGSCLSGDVLRQTLAEYKCQVLLMLDSCHSAGIGQGNQKLANLKLRPATDNAARDLTENGYGVAVMCAAMGNEKAEGIAGYGLFTKAVLEALAQGPVNPFNHRQYVHHLQSYVFDHVSHRSEERQHPFLSLPWVMESFVVR